MQILDKIFRLDGQTAVVTGGGDGLGRAFAIALAGAGADVALIDINSDGLETTAADVRSLGRQAFQYTCDVSEETRVAETFAEIGRDAGAIDILVNNAGIGDGFLGLAHEYPSDVWQRRIDVNLNSVFYCSREALKVMHARRKGKIINIASIWGLTGGSFVNIAGYAATKGAVVNLTREMALQYAPHNVQINAICPGFHRTDLATSHPELMESMESHTPAGRLGEPSELHGTVIYLASSASNFMCGSLIVVDGGYLAQ